MTFVGLGLISAINSGGSREIAAKIRATVPKIGIYDASERILGTTVGIRGLGMPAPSTFAFEVDAAGRRAGLAAWRGHLYAVRNGGVYRLVEGDGTWTSEAVVAPGEVNYPTAVGVDNFGNLWVVEAQFGDLFDMDPATNGTTPFRVVRFATTTR